MQASSTGHGTAVKSAPPLQQPIRSKVGGIAKQSISSSSKHPNAGRVKEAPKTVPKIKRIPPPTWTDLDISLSLAEAEQRIHIREFTLRFASVIEISRAHLDELEEMKPYRSGEESELVPWVSEGCVKSLTVGLLNLLDVEGEDKKVPLALCSSDTRRFTSNFIIEIKFCYQVHQGKWLQSQQDLVRVEHPPWTFDVPSRS